MLGECPNFQGGTRWKNQGKWTKTGNSLAMRMGKWEILDQNFGKSPGTIFRHLITILLHYKRIYSKK